MRSVTHKEQQRIWNEEHSSPQVLLQMDSIDPSSGVTKFWQWYKNVHTVNQSLQGIEMGCGKGRNAIWLAKQQIKMTGFDFSSKAIEVASKRADDAKVEDITTFLVQDATKRWKFSPNFFDFGIDCFATTDIESRTGRYYAASEMSRVLKLNAYILVYALSTEDAFHKEMITKSPVSEKNAFIHPTGKFEKVFTRDELLDLYRELEPIVEERVTKVATFSEKQYDCYHHWIIFQKKK